MARECCCGTSCTAETALPVVYSVVFSGTLVISSDLAGSEDPAVCLALPDLALADFM